MFQESDRVEPRSEVEPMEDFPSTEEEEEDEDDMFTDMLRVVTIWDFAGNH